MSDIACFNKVYLVKTNLLNDNTHFMQRCNSLWLTVYFFNFPLFSAVRQRNKISAQHHEFQDWYFLMFQFWIHIGPKKLPCKRLSAIAIFLIFALFIMYEIANVFGILKSVSFTLLVFISVFLISRFDCIYQKISWTFVLMISQLHLWGKYPKTIEK